MAARRPFWKWRRCKSIGFCLWPPSTCIWNLKLKFQSKLDTCPGNHVVYRQTDRRTDGRTDKVNPVYPPSNFVGRGFKYGAIYNNFILHFLLLHALVFERESHVSRLSCTVTFLCTLEKIDSCNGKILDQRRKRLDYDEMNNMHPLWRVCKL